jgi:PadR family transcriptional regulator PadR
MMKVQREWMRGAGPLAVLKLLDGGDMYGYQLAEALEAGSDGLLAMGHSTLYPLLYNLESKGLVEPARERTEKGRRRKYWRITGKGRAWLEEHGEEWGRLVEAMTKLGFA